jgi:hypothetical protein
MAPNVRKAKFEVVTVTEDGREHSHILEAVDGTDAIQKARKERAKTEQDAFSTIRIDECVRY